MFALRRENIYLLIHGRGRAPIGIGSSNYIITIRYSPQSDTLMMVIRLLLLLPPMMIIMSFTYKDNRPYSTIMCLLSLSASISLSLYVSLVQQLAPMA